MSSRKKDKNSEENVTEAGPKRQYLAFRLADEFFGMELDQTREILEYSDVTDVPLMPNFMVGVINLRGDVVPVIDLSIRLGRQAIQINKRTCIVIVELHSYDQEHILGLLVDSVSEVIDIAESAIEDAPAFGAKIRAEFIQGIAKVDNDFIVLLDAEKTLSPIELAHIVESELQGSINEAE